MVGGFAMFRRRVLRGCQERLIDCKLKAKRENLRWSRSTPLLAPSPFSRSLKFDCIPSHLISLYAANTLLYFKSSHFIAQPQTMCINPYADAMHKPINPSKTLYKLNDSQCTYIPCAPVPLCTARSSLSLTTALLTPSTNPFGPQHTTALSPRACSNDLRMILRGVGRPANSAISGCIRSFFVDNPAIESWDEERESCLGAASESTPQQHGFASLLISSSSSMLAVQQHVAVAPHAPSPASDSAFDSISWMFVST